MLVREILYMPIHNEIKGQITYCHGAVKDRRGVIKVIDDSHDAGQTQQQQISQDIVKATRWIIQYVLRIRPRESADLSATAIHQNAIYTEDGVTHIHGSTDGRTHRPSDY